MLLYNSLTHKREEFIPNTPGYVKMYTCGPTVYHFAHIGNLRTYIMEDVLEKYLCYCGYEVKRVMNITDVGHLSSDADTGEDKMLKGARREHKSVMEIARFYTEAFFADCQKLHIKIPEIVEPATSCIPEFIHLVETLLEKGYAYLIHPSWMNIMSLINTRLRTWSSAPAKVLRRTETNETKQISFCGLQSQSLKIRS